MTKEILGLPLRHPVIILNAVSAVLFTFYFVMAITRLDMPHRYPYPVSALGAAAICILAVKATAEGDTGSTRVGYALTALSIITSCGDVLTVVAYLMGSSSGLWHLMNSIPLPK